MMWGGYGYDGTWLGMGLMMLFGIMILIGVVLLVIWAAQAAFGGGQRHDRGGTSEACDIAKVRYARGEISQDEYFQICRNIGA